MRGWLWFIRQYGIVEASYYWLQGRRHGWMTHDEFMDFLADNGYPPLATEQPR